MSERRGHRRGGRTDDVLVGRARELAGIARALDRLVSGQGGIIQIVGEPGIGKTRLVGEAVTEARRLGRLALVGRAMEFERTLPFGVFVEAIDEALRDDVSDRLAGLDPQQMAELAAVFPALALDHQPSTFLQFERYRAHESVAALLDALATPVPLVLVLEDLHWADEASAELVSYLLRNHREGPILMLLSYRPGQASPQLVANFDYAYEQGWSERIALEPLSEQESAEMIGGGFDRETVRDLYSRSGGNPFYLEELSRVYDGSEPADRAAPPSTELGVPPAISAGIAEEIRSLPDRTRVVAQAAAIAGDPFAAEFAAQIAAGEQTEAEALLEQLLELDLLRHHDSGRRLRFRHPIVRRAVYESSGLGWRIGAHRRAVAALEAGGASPAARALHIERSASPGDEQAIATLVEAADTTAPQAPAGAASWYRAALELLPESSENEQRRVQLLVLMAGAQAAAGQLGQSQETLGKVIEELPEEQAALRPLAVYFVVRCAILLGEMDSAERYVLDTIASITDADSEEAGALKSEMCTVYFHMGDFTQACEWAQAAIDTPVDALWKIATIGTLAVCEYGAGEIEAATRHARESAAQIDHLSDDDLTAYLEASVWISWIEVLLERPNEALEQAARGIAVVRASGRGDLLPLLLAGQSLALIYSGRSEEACSPLDQAIESTMLGANRMYLTFALALRCWAETELGRLPAALASGEQAVAARPDARTPLSTFSTCCLAEAALESGDAARCHALLSELLADPDLIPFPHYEARWYELLARAELELGDLAAARESAAAAAAIAAKHGLQGQIAFAERAAAAVALAEQDPEQATNLALSACEKAGAAGMAVEAARARLLAGEALAASGDRDEATRQLEQAELELGSCRAARYRDQAAAALRRLGHHGGSGRFERDEPGVAGLTGRQTEVAELIALGKTNRQIAQQLFLSETGVEAHVKRIFAKLGVNSRAAIAAQVGRSQPAG